MKVSYIPIKQITFEQKNYPNALKESIARIGISFPIRLRVIKNGYLCVDGHKRLSVLTELDVNEVMALVEDDGSMRTQSSWTLMNHH